MKELIRRKRDGAELSSDEIEYWVRGVADGSVPDYQSAALLMAITIRGMTRAETIALTEAMLRSGRTLDWSRLGRPTVDKHSTGGVGDKVSLALAPWVAACGAAVPMIAGRGLGHTGGTLDKLEAIPGFRVRIDVEAFRSQLERIGVVFDVKCGGGAFMRGRDEALTLARELVSTARELGRKARALLTDMEQPLGATIGNANEVAEAFGVLRGDAPPDLTELTRDLGTAMLVLCGVARERFEGAARLDRALESGEALRRAEAFVQAQGGDPGVVADPARLRRTAPPPNGPTPRGAPTPLVMSLPRRAR